MKHLAIRAGTGAAVLVAALVILAPSRRALYAVSGTAYGQAQNEAQQPRNDQSNSQSGTHPIAANPSAGKSGDKENSSQGPDWPTIVQAASAFVSAIATAFIFVVTSRQAKLSHQQLELSRQEAAYTRRPHFRVRFARLVKKDGKLLAEGKPVTVMLDVLNNGQADAVVFGSHFEIHWTNDGLSDGFPQYENGRRNEFATKGKDSNIILAGGGNLNIEMPGYRIMGDQALDVEWGRKNWTMYLLGWIGYRRTDNPTDRFFDFGLQYRPGTGRFLPMDDPDYSHDPDAK